MSLSAYQNIAAQIASVMQPSSPAVIIVTSSTSTADTLSAAKKIGGSLKNLGQAIAVVNALDENASSLSQQKDDSSGAALFELKKEENAILSPNAAATLIQTLKEKFDIILIVTKPFEESQAALLLAGAAGHMLLIEQKNHSRTDRIDTVLETAKNIHVKPLGFILLN